MLSRLALGRCVELLNEVGLGGLNADQTRGEWFGVCGGELEVSVHAYGADDQFLLDTAANGIVDPTGTLIERSTEDALRLWVEVRVSGRVDGQRTMLGLVDRLLVSGGYVQDDHTDRLWTATDVRNALDGAPGPRA